MKIKDFKELLKTTKIINCCRVGLYHDQKYAEMHQLLKKNNTIHVNRIFSFYGRRSSPFYKHLYLLEDGKFYSINYSNKIPNQPSKIVHNKHVDEWLDKSKQLLLKEKLNIILKKRNKNGRI